MLIHAIHDEHQEFQKQVTYVCMYSMTFLNLVAGFEGLLLRHLFF
jgi:hypothetical protein